MYLPQQADYTNGASVVLVDYPLDLEDTVTADSTGTATATFDPVDQPFIWRVERLTTYLSVANPPAGARCVVYKGPTLLPIRARDGSASPSFDFADEASPITVHPSYQLVIQWTGLTPGTQASVAVQYQLWRRIIAGS